MLDVFLSYARAENEPLARELFLRLSAAGLKVWWDRESMPSRSLTFLQEIRLAVHDATRTVVIVDEPALRSEYVKAEWQYALAAGKPVVPLLRAESFDRVPPELAGLHCPDFREKRPLEEAVAELLRVLSDEVPPLGRLLGEVPGLPPRFQPRTRDTTRLAGEAMLGRNAPVTVRDSQRITVIHGMGGSGKSVLAAAFARSTATRQAFADGIAWLPSGPDTTPERLLRALARQLGGESRSWQAPSDFVEGVRELLQERRVLVVLDNVGAVETVEPLISALDVDSRVVVTTRLAGLAVDLGARALALGELEPAEALQHLADWAGCDPAELPPAAARLAAECGYLPFALALNGAMVKRGTSWDDLLEALGEHELEFARTQDRFAHYPYPNVLRCIKPSVDDLERTQPDAATRLAELAAFHWDQGVPEAAVTRFWVHRGSPSARDARQVLITLADRSLLRLDGEAPRRLVRVHDLQLDYLLATCADAAKLCRTLLDSYRSDWNDWPAVPPDGYLHQHLVRHLVELGALDDLERLIDLEDEAGGNVWFQAAEVADNLGGYLDDLDRATDALANAGEGVAVAVHHSLLRASINSLSSSLSDAIRCAALRTSMWSSARALAEARQVADVDSRVRALLELVPHLDPFERTLALEEGVALARTRGNQPCAGHLTFAAGLAEPAQRTLLLDEARTVARSISSPGYRATALARVAQLWPEAGRDALLAEALEAATQEVDTAGENQAGFDALGILSALLPPSSLPRLIELVRRVPDGFCRAVAYSQVAPHVPDPAARASLAAEGLAVERTVEGNSVWIRIALTVHLPDVDAEKLFDEVVTEDARHAGYLVSLLPGGMSAAQATHWLARLRAVAFDNDYERFNALFSISSRFEGAARQRLVDELATLAADLPYGRWRSQAYDDIAPHLTREQLQAATRILRALGDTHGIGRALADLLPRLECPLREQAVDFIVQRIDRSQSLDVIVAAAAAVEKDTRTRLVQHALAARRDGASFGGGAYFPDLAIDTLAQLARLSNIDDRVEVLQHLVDWTFNLWDPETGAHGLAAAAELLDSEFVDGCVAELARSAAHVTVHGAIQSVEGTRTGRPEVLAMTLHALAPLMHAKRAAAMLEHADVVADPGWRMAARVAVAPRLTEPARSEVLDDATRVAATLDLVVDDLSRNPWRPLTWLCKALPDDAHAPVAELAIKAAQAVGESWRPGALAEVAALFAGRRRDEIVEEALALDSPYAAPVLVPFFSMDRAWPVARRAALETIGWSAHPTAELAPLLARGPAGARIELWQELAPELRSLTRADLSARYVALRPLLEAVGGPQATGRLARSLLSTARWWP